MISPLAYVHPDAKLGENVTVEPFAYIAGDVEIGDDCWIGPGAVIHDGARIGKRNAQMQELETKKLAVVASPKTGVAYKFGFYQEELKKDYFAAGGMDGYYMATTESASAAIDVYLEAANDGYYFYTIVDDAKLYINMVVNGTHVNGAYEATAKTVYTYDSAAQTDLRACNSDSVLRRMRYCRNHKFLKSCIIF